MSACQPQLYSDAPSTVDRETLDFSPSFRNMGRMMARRRDYPIIRFVIAAFYGLALLALVGGISSAAYLWIRAEIEGAGNSRLPPLPSALSAYSTTELYWSAVIAAAGGFLLFLFLGAFAQALAMQRDRAIAACLQVQLLEDILSQNEDAAASAPRSRVELCEGCGRLGSLQRIDSGQWVCRDCGRQLRSA